MGLMFFAATESKCMPNHDFVSGSLLALTAGGVALLCSSLLALALI